MQKDFPFTNALPKHSQHILYMALVLGACTIFRKDNMNVYLVSQCSIPMHLYYTYVTYVYIYLESIKLDVKVIVHSSGFGIYGQAQCYLYFNVSKI